jgi:site-specific recombinase XerD
MATVSLYLDIRQTKLDGTHAIRLQIAHIGRFYIATGLSCSPDNWDKDKFSTKEPNYRAKNARLLDMFNKVQMYFLLHEDEVAKMSDKRVKELVKYLIGDNPVKTKFFIDYMEEFIQRKTKGNTIATYTMTLNRLKEYDPHATFQTIDKRWLESFEFAMEKEGLKTNTRGIHFRNIRAVFNYCIDEEYTNLYPFRRFSIKKEETRKRSLTIEQLRAFRDNDCEEYQKRYIDIFMLSFYLLGINMVDLLNAKPNALRDGRFEYKRAKTSRLYSILVQPEAMEIIERYKGEEHLLNIMDEYKDHKNFIHRMNIGLRQIGTLERKGRGGKKYRTPLFPDISTYWARHTWATIAAGLDIPKETIAHALGHAWATNTTTDIYIKFDEKKVDEANRKVLDAIKG